MGGYNLLHERFSSYVFRRRQPSCPSSTIVRHRQDDGTGLDEVTRSLTSDAQLDYMRSGRAFSHVAALLGRRHLLTGVRLSPNIAHLRSASVGLLSRQTWSRRAYPGAALALATRDIA